MDPNDLIGRLVIPVDEAGAPVIAPDRDEAWLRVQFSEAQRELDAIDEVRRGAGTMTPADARRRALVYGYQHLIREAVTAIVDALAQPGLELPSAAGTPVEETVRPGENPQSQPLSPPARVVPEAAPAAQPEKAPEKAPKKADDALEPVLEPAMAASVPTNLPGAAVADADGNRYQLVAVPALAAAVDGNTIGAEVARFRPGGARLFERRPVGQGLTLPKAPMLAALPGQTLGAGHVDSHGNEVTASDVGQRLHRFANTRVDQPTSAPLFRRDRLAQVDGLSRLTTSMSPEAAELEMANIEGRREALLAAFCGPAELDRTMSLIAPSTARPIAAAMGTAIPIGLGVHEFFREMGLADLLDLYIGPGNPEHGLGLWTTGDQALVSPTDPTTWKPYFTLPGCSATIRVSAYFLYRALRVTIEDTMSRPQYIDNITLLMEVLLARLAEQALLETIDGWSFQRTAPISPTGYGAARQVFYVVSQALAWSNTATRSDRTAYTFVVPDTLAAVCSIDNVMAGEDPNAWVSWLAGIGVDVLVTPDWGLEGNPMPMMPIGPTPDTPDPDNGDPLAPFPTLYTTRLVPFADFVWGSVGIEDYGAMSSPDLRRQNAIEYFGETAEIAYKKGGYPSFTIDLAGILGNGARPDRVTPFTYVQLPANNYAPFGPIVSPTFVAGNQLAPLVEPPVIP